METRYTTVSEQNTMEAIQAMNRKTPDIHPLTVRDLFAMAAMQGNLARPGQVTDKSEFARSCYEMADAMMEARK